MSKSILLLSAVSLIALTGCQTANNGWSDWEGIPYTEALLEWPTDKPTDLFARKVAYNGDYQEQWDWEKGQIFISKAGHARFARIEITPTVFGEHMASWKTFKETGLKIKPSEVTETSNKYGKFYFGELKTDTGEDCLGFMQAIKEFTAAGYVDNGQPDGYLVGFDCGDDRFTSSSILEFANSITYRK